MLKWHLFRYHLYITFCFKDLVTHRSEFDTLKKNVDVMRQMMVQNHQDMADLLGAMRSLESDVTTLTQAFNQYAGNKPRKERKRTARITKASSSHVPDFEPMKEFERVAAAAAITADAVTVTGNRSLSLPGIAVPPDSFRYGRRSSKFVEIKKKLSVRRSQPPGKGDEV